MLAPNSGELVPVEGSIKGIIDKSFADLPEEYKKAIPFTDKVYKIKPTPESPKGTRGRMAVFEMFAMDKDIEKIILENPVESAVFRAARAKGMLTMKEDAMIKAFNKVIPFEEVIKL
jgi:type II secretory ATPase GspE/PulE/Tfp pilus assembly ATPase PilB-like protein